MMGMARRPTTLYLDDEILRAARAMAARSERDESRVVEDALRSYLGLTVVEEVWRRSDLSEEQALALADEEKHAARE
jgi:predicted transcriptional regulator